jgi:molybdenum cofactor biosynthesis enzyme MoaA
LEDNHLKNSQSEETVLCPLPFVHPFFDVRGLYSACCNGSFNENSKHISKLTAEQWFYSLEMQELRSDMLNGNRNKMCNHCWEKDDMGIRSPRLTHREIWKWHNIDYANPKPMYFDLKPSNHCNLACIFCTSSSSDKIIKITESLSEDDKPSRWAGSLEAVKKREALGTFDPTVVDYIKNNIRDLKLIKFTGGEPFLSKEVLDILKIISEENPECELKITTNGTVITKDFFPVLEKIKKISIKFSIDAVGELYSYIRFPSKWNQFQKRIEMAMNNLPNVNFNVNCLITNMNLEQLPKIIKWYKELESKYTNLKFIILDPNMTPNNNESSLHMMDPVVLKNLKNKLEQYDWDLNCKTEKQMSTVVFKKIDDCIRNTLYSKEIVRKEFNRQNKIRKLNIQDVLEPITSQYYKKLLEEDR